MNPTRLRALRAVLILVGLVSMALWPLMMHWPSGWSWEPHHHEYQRMIVAVYFTLGVFLLRAAADPLRHLSLIWFTAWSSAAHGAAMLYDALRSAEHRGHLVADIPALLIAAALLAYLTPRRTPAP